MTLEAILGLEGAFICFESRHDLLPRGGMRLKPVANELMGGIMPKLLEIPRYLPDLIISLANFKVAGVMFSPPDMRAISSTRWS